MRDNFDYIIFKFDWLFSNNNLSFYIYFQIPMPFNVKKKPLNWMALMFPNWRKYAKRYVYDPYCWNTPTQSPSFTFNAGQKWMSITMKAFENWVMLSVIRLWSFIVNLLEVQTWHWAKAQITLHRVEVVVNCLAGQRNICLRLKMCFEIQNIFYTDKICCSTGSY